MKCAFIFYMILSLVGISTTQQETEQARTIELTLYPAETPEPLLKYQLLPKSEEQSDTNAAFLYEKAVQSLPNNLQNDLLNNWSRAALKELPIEQVKSTLQQLEHTVQLLEEAAKCKHCKWPDSEISEDQLLEDMSKYHRIIYIIALKIHLQIAQNYFDEAIASLQTGFSTAKHLAENPNLTYGLIGISTATFMCKQLEQFIQGTDAPNLFWAL